MKKLVWLTVNRSWSHSSLALPLLHEAGRSVSGWEWRREEVTDEEDSVRVATRILSEPCDLLCATLYLFNRLKVFDILKRVHALSPETHIAVGGPECSPDRAPVLLEENPFLSTMFCGEGEALFPEFLRNFEEERTLRRVIPEQGSTLYENWAEAELPEKDPFFRTDRPFVQIETARGCPMACRYCTSSGVGVRYRSLDRVKEELDLLRERGVREVRVLDRTFNLPMERGEKLLRLFFQYPEIRFHLEVHPQFLNESLKECFRSAAPDQLHVEAGIQSMDPAVQQAIGRRASVEETVAGVKFLTECPGFETHTDLLSGLPGQTLASLRQDIARLMSIGPREIQLEVLKMLPGTPILGDAEKYGMVWSPEPPYDVMKTGTMSMEEVLVSRELSRLLDLFYNHKSLHPVLKKACQAEKNVFLRLADSLHGKDLNSFLNVRKRMEALEHFLGTGHTEALETLSLEWLKAGFPPDEGPGKRAVPIRSIPDNAVFVSGSAESRSHRASRFYRLGDFYLVFNRFLSGCGFCGVWEAGNTGSFPSMILR